MADESVSITPGAGADIAVDTVAGKHYQRVKLDLGADGVATPLALGQTTKANSIPVTNASDDTIVTSLAAIQAAVELIDNAVTGSAFNVIPSSTYTEGDTDASITGQAILWEDAADTLRAVSSAKPFPVNIVAGGGSGGTAIADDADFVAGSTVGTPIQGVYESAPTSVTDGDAGWVGINATRAMRVELAASTIDVASGSADGGDPVKVGSKAITALAAVDANDRANAVSDLFGRLLTAHIDPAMQVWKQVEYTTAQTGAVIWDPTGGKKIAITSYQLGTTTATAGLVTLWFGDNADATFTQGTDQVLFRGSLTPTATGTPGVISNFTTPVYCATADRELHLTTVGDIDIFVTVYGYEF